MERRKYIAELVARTGVQVDEDDPVFAVVLLNRLIMEDQKSELETLVEQLSKTGKAISGEVVKQAQTLWDTKTRQLHAEAAELKVSMLREHEDLQKSTREAVGKVINEAMGQLGRSTKADNNRAIWTAALVSGAALICLRLGFSSARLDGAIHGAQSLRNQSVGSRCSSAASGPRLVAVIRIRRSCGPSLAYSTKTSK